ncbi:FecR family protein [Sphingobacterium corticibacter]|uniref:FecR family protein n=1 Tax=Sphingobacterium corticibacter TaxID=2171749 RepID=A0A2T8HJC8_9SPHI|nr:FecR family protein [Sphingobacterium corticibacter]PVH25503.1 hypothetical protein DC487_06015 [Sphingobacterium corticibacter]
MNATERIAELIKRYIEGKLTLEESETLTRWRKLDDTNEAFFQQVTQGEEVFGDALQWIDMEDEHAEQQLDQIKQLTFDKLHQTQSIPLRRNRIRPFIYKGAAAALLICASVFGYFQLREHATSSENIEAASILPGGNKAELVLSDGQKINLRSDKDGIVLDQELNYSDGTPLLAIDKEKLAQTTASITVPVGGKYRVTLSDGTHVHLNAQSKLTYPLLFNSQKRQVSIEGEAYFEVAQQYVNNRRVPFEVNCQDQIIRVTGTSFNVSAYADDPQTLTTLVEGSVEIETTQGRLSLRPNEQAVVQHDRINKKQVDVASYVAWKDNNFLFFETELKDLMKQISRWYAVEVSYPKAIPPTYFYGEITREKNLSEVLRILEKAGVKFELSKAGGKVRLQVNQ